MRSTTAIAATLLASASQALAGQFLVNNWCNYDVWLWNVKDFNQGNVNRVAAHTIYSSPWLTANNGGGVSVKIANQNDASLMYKNQVLQFEYTNAGGNIWYDLSNLNGTPFSGTYIRASPVGGGADQNSCNRLHCPPGRTCADAYERPDDIQTHACPGGIDIWLDLCDPKGDNWRSKRSLNTLGMAEAPFEA